MDDDWERRELLEQRITSTLQTIDANFAACQKAATTLLGEVKQFVGSTQRVTSGTRVWSEWLNTFTSTETQYSRSVMPPPPPSPSLSPKMSPAPATMGVSGHSPTLPSPPRTTPFRRPHHFNMGNGPTPVSTPSIGSISPPRTQPFRRTLSPMEALFGEVGASPQMSSPPKTTKLDRGMVPRMDVSDNDAIGRCLDVEDFEEEVEMHEDVPEFDLSLFPEVFRQGEGAMQITEMYSKFYAAPEESGVAAFNMEQLRDLMPDYAEERIQLLVDTLVSRRLVRPMYVNGQMFWRLK